MVEAVFVNQFGWSTGLLRFLAKCVIIVLMSSSLDFSLGFFLLDFSWMELETKFILFS